MIVLLLSRGADINARTVDGTTLLHFHATHASGELIRFLLECGADPHAKTKANQTPWAIAVEQGNREAAEILFRGAQADDSGPLPGGSVSRNPNRRSRSSGSASGNTSGRRPAPATPASAR
jgi:ankyrin repeat protein